MRTVIGFVVAGFLVALMFFSTSTAAVTQAPFHTIYCLHNQTHTGEIGFPVEACEHIQERVTQDTTYQCEEDIHYWLEIRNGRYAGRFVYGTIPLIECVRADSAIDSTWFFFTGELCTDYNIDHYCDVT